jgi:uncharacterized protein (DUF488 family)
MLTRQKVILSLIRQETGPIGRIVLYKYAFLLSHEFDIPSDLSFYQFVPFMYGPYSFALARELQSLEQYGYVASDSGRYWISPRMEDEVKNIILQIPQGLRWQASSISSKYGALKQDELLRTVYNAYPSFTFRSKLHQLVPPNAAEPAKAPIRIYTMGYQGKSVDGFFNTLVQAGLRNIIDVRANPVSRKYGFAKSALSGIATKLSIGYKHIADLGIPSRDRKGLGTPESYITLLDDYEFRVLPSRTEPRRAALEAIKAQPSVLVCAEADAEFCHRGRVAKSLSSESGLPIRHL